MLVVAVEQLLGVDCEVDAQAAFMRKQARREWSPFRSPLGGVQPLLMYGTLEAEPVHVA